LIALEDTSIIGTIFGLDRPFSSRDWTSRHTLMQSAMERNAYTRKMLWTGPWVRGQPHTGKPGDSILKAAGKTKIPVVVAQGSADG